MRGVLKLALTATVLIQPMSGTAALGAAASNAAEQYGFCYVAIGYRTKYKGYKEHDTDQPPSHYAYSEVFRSDVFSNAPSHVWDLPGVYTHFFQYLDREEDMSVYNFEQECVWASSKEQSDNQKAAHQAGLGKGWAVREYKWPSSTLKIMAGAGPAPARSQEANKPRPPGSTALTVKIAEPASPIGPRAPQKASTVARGPDIKVAPIVPRPKTISNCPPQCPAVPK